LGGFPGAFVIYMLLSAINRPFQFDILDLLGTYATVSAITILFGLPLALAARRRLKAEEPAPVAEAISPFFRRLPPKLGTDLLSLTAEDHYVRVTTVLGSDLVLIRLSDAIAEIGAEKGQRVHRSHWVAGGAVASVDRQSGKTALVLSNGESVPVSQSYLASLREAGWL
jgi:DNA-binding LytR/AlgR family response regulator